MKDVMTFIHKLITDKAFAIYVEEEYNELFFKAMNYSEWKNNTKFQVECSFALGSYELEQSVFEEDF